ncbi:hypothetical protein ABK040_005128 [Willaertia magna]
MTMMKKLQTSPQDMMRMESIAEDTLDITSPRQTRLQNQQTTTPPLRSEVLPIPIFKEDYIISNPISIPTNGRVTTSSSSQPQQMLERQSTFEIWKSFFKRKTFSKPSSSTLPLSSSSSPNNNNNLSNTKECRQHSSMSSSCNNNKQLTLPQMRTFFTLQKKLKPPKLYKFLVCGPLGGGKSTLFRQYKLAFQEGFDAKEISRMRTYIYANILQTFGQIMNLHLEQGFTVNQLSNNGSNIRQQNITNEEVIIEEEDDDNECTLTDEDLQLVSQFRYTLNDKAFFQHVSLLKQICKYININELFNLYNLEGSILDGIEYYLQSLSTTFLKKDLIEEELSKKKKIDKVCILKEMFDKQESYIPSLDDIVHSRCKTTGITCIDYEYMGMISKVFDVGGARNERKKWNHIYPNLSSLFYVTSLMDFTKKCYEDDTSNRLLDALQLFEECCNGPFKYSPVFLVFTKVDTLEECFVNNNPLIDGKKEEELLCKLFPEFSQFSIKEEEGEAFHSFFNDPMNQRYYLNEKKNVCVKLADENGNVNEKKVLSNQVIRYMSFIEAKFRARNAHHQQRIVSFYLDATDTDQFKEFIEIVHQLVYNCFDHSK